MKLKLERPICFIDIESTGLNREHDRIVEISIIKLHPDQSKEVRTRRVNPGVVIPEESIAIHGITNEMVDSEPTFNQIANGLLKLIDGCDIGGFGSNAYDAPLLYNEFLRAGITWDYSKVKFIDVGNIYKIQNPRTLGAAYQEYTGNALVDAHGAEPDALATLEVFLAQLERHELPETVEELSVYSNYDKRMLDLSGKFTYDEKGDIIFNFGPNRGQPAIDHLDFVSWMFGKDFPPDTLAICQKLLRINREPEVFN